MRTPLEQMLVDLVRRPSVNPMGRNDLPSDLVYESRVTECLEQGLRRIGAEYERIQVALGRDNLIARYSPSQPSPVTLLFEAHQDTVPVDGMTIDPFEARIERGRLYGRGACDVKAGVAAMFAAFARLVQERPGSASVVLAFTVDEEHTFLGVQHLMASGVKADFAVVAEPTNLQIVRAHKGVVRWQMETTGVACHSSRPERGVNAVYRMARLVTVLQEYAAKLQVSRVAPLLGAPTLSVGTIRGGVSPNTVPDACRIDVDRRLIPGETADEAIADIVHFLVGRPEIDFPYSIHRTLACPPLNPVGGDEFVSRLGLAIDSVAGSHEVLGVPYGTDASTIREAGIPAVVFGPGDIAQAHTSNEWVELAEVEQAAEILFRFATTVT